MNEIWGDKKIKNLNNEILENAQVLLSELLYTHKLHGLRNNDYLTNN